MARRTGVQDAEHPHYSMGGRAVAASMRREIGFGPAGIGRPAMGDFHIRPARQDDLGAVNDIYNHFVIHSTCTFQTEPEPLERRAEWFAAHDASHPIIVAEKRGAEGSKHIVGWASLSAFNARCAYRHTVEDSVYVAHDAHGEGIGSRLLADLIERAAAIGHHSIVGLVVAEQDVSLRLHEKFGFERVAHLREVGYKFDRWIDVIYMQRML
jgi:L-amino acid N-acyltransferase YncA